MKKLLTLIAVSVTITASAQKAAVQTAYNYMRYEEFDKAKEAIDGAALSESTMGMAKTWYYRGCIYHAIFQAKDKYVALKPGSLAEARKSYEKAMELDAKKEYSDDIKSRLAAVEAQMIGEGAARYQEGKFSEAQQLFESAADLASKNFNQIDTLALYNSGLSADKAGDKKTALKYYSQVAGMNYGGARMYSMMAGIQLDMKDSTAAMTSIRNGRQKFPEDGNLLLQELNMYLASGKDAEAFTQMDQAIAKDTANANLYFAKGSLADKLGKQDVATKCYKKAIALKADYFEPNYNLGAMIFNEAAEMVNKANAIPTNKMAEYDAAKKKFEAKFKEAQPYLEKAHQINPGDKATIQSLKALYARVGDLKKADEMKKALDALK